MYESIARFIRNDIKEIEKNIQHLLDGSIDSAELSIDLQKRLETLGSSMISEIYELIDQEIFNSLIRKKNWYVEHKDEPRELVEYVVVHELTHLRAHDHGPAFKAFMDARLPDWRLRRRRLRHV